MPVLHEKYRILLWISLALFSGFVASGIAARFIAVDAARQDVLEHALPLTSDAVNAEIRAEMMRPIVAASQLAGEQRVRDWLAEGEAGNEAIVSVLQEIRTSHGAQRVLLASELSRKTYGADASAEPIQENNARDAWFFRAKNAKTAISSEFATDGASNRATGLSGVVRIVDREGRFLAAAVVELGVERLARAIEAHRGRDGSRILVADAHRRVLAIGTAPAVAGSIDALPGLRDIAPRLLHQDSTPAMMQYQKHGDTVHVSSRFIPELGVHLLVERDDDAGAETARYLFFSSLLIGAGVTVLVIVLMLLTINRYHERLAQMAGSDPLTGLLNRQAFDIVFRQTMLDADRNGRPLSGILFDVDFIRQVNEVHGYAAGDEVLRTIARIAKAMLRESDVFTRWNGEEFFILLKECPVEQAVVIAEKIRAEVDRNDFSASVPDGHITISLGVAQHEAGETTSLFLGRADEALFKAKANGRNRLQVARSSGAPNTEGPSAS